MNFIAKSMTNLAKGGASALSSVTSYVDGQLEKKHKAEFQDKLSAKSRQEYGNKNKIMTDDEFEQYQNEKKKWEKIAETSKNSQESTSTNENNKPQKYNDKKYIERIKKHQSKKENLKRMKQSRNLQTTEIDESLIDEDRYKQKMFWDDFKDAWKYYDAAKRDDTALFYFGHSKDGGKDGHTCKDRIKQGYDKRYGEFFCIDDNNANDPDIYDKMIDSMKRAIKKKLPYFKLYLDAHGHYDDDYVALNFSMDTLIKLVALFSGELDGKTIIFVKTACFDGDDNRPYDFNYEDVGQLFSIMCPHSKIVMEDHIDKTSSHYVTERKYAISHYKLKYRIIQNGTEKIVTKKQKNQEIGGSYSNKKSYSPEEDIPWKGLCVFLPTVAAVFCGLIGVGGVKACCEACRRRQRQNSRPSSANQPSNRSDINHNNIENVQSNINVHNGEQSENNIQQSERNDILRFKDNNTKNINLNVGNGNHLSRNINNDVIREVNIHNGKKFATK